MKPDISLVVPTFREYTFEDALDRLLGYVSALPDRVEVVIVDDSDDELWVKMQGWVEARRRDLDPHVELRLLRGPRRGKGAAVRAAALAAEGDVILTLDADLSVPLEAVPAFAARVRAGADVVVGERSPDRNADNLVRDVLSRGLLVVQTALVFHGRRFKDTQCGFKAYRGDVLKRLATLQVVDGGMYDLEYLYAATRAGLKIERLPVETRPEVRPSRINLVACLVRDPRDILRVKARGLLGRYG
jgi:glycosyltransferase involved in cell wall biosynthesis